jgi:hypothetical protein
MIINIHGMYTFTISAIMLLSQYDSKFIPEINYMCFSPSARSISMKLTITHGIIATPIETINENSSEFYSFDL